MINQKSGFEYIIKEEFYVHSFLKRGTENDCALMVYVAT